MFCIVRVLTQKSKDLNIFGTHNCILLDLTLVRLVILCDIEYKRASTYVAFFGYNYTDSTVLESLLWNM